MKLEVDWRYTERGKRPWGRSIWQICNLLKPGKEFKNTATGKIYKMDYCSGCNNWGGVYLITYKVRKKCDGSTVAKFRVWYISWTWII